MSQSTVAAIQKIVELAEQEGVPLGKTRLVKLLYLLDVEHCRRFGHRLTDLHWVFYHYGPYAFELEQLLGESMVVSEDVPLAGGRAISRLRAEEGRHEESGLDYKAEGIVGALFREWATSDLRELLNHVYFDTEPMVAANRGDSLDFHTVRPFVPPQNVRLDSRRVKEIRRKTKEFLAANPTPRVPPLGNLPELAAALRLWGAEPSRITMPSLCDVAPVSEHPNSEPQTDD